MQFKRISSFRNWKIQNKILACMMSVIVLMGIVIMLMISTLVGNIISQKSLTQTAETINQVSINVGNELDLITERVSYLAFNPSVQQQLAEDIKADVVDATGARRMLSPWLVQAYDGAAMNMVEIHGNSGQNYFISSNSAHGLSTDLQDLKTNPEYVAYLTLAQSVYGKPITINENVEDGAIQIVKAIYDLTTLKSLGVVRAEVKKDALYHLFEEVRFDSEGYLLIVDEKGKLVVGTKEIESWYIDEALTQISGKNGEFESKTNGEQYYGVYNEIEGTGWYAIGFLPKSVLLQEVSSIKITILIVGVLTLFGCLIIARTLSYNVVKPLEEMTDGLKRFSNGDFNVQMEQQSTDEIGTMGRVFNKMIVQIRTLIDQVYRGELLKKEAEFKMLQAQINPHFLYNTLDTINWMARRAQADDVCKMVTAVSNLMRISISNQQSFIALSEEIQYIEDYLFIQKARYRDKLQVTMAMEGLLGKQQVPKLILQPLVENAVVHGLENCRTSMEINISGQLQGDIMVFRIIDTGQGIAREIADSLLSGTANHTKENHTGLGIATVHQRIGYIYGEGYGLQIESQIGKGTCMTVRIPYSADPMEFNLRYQSYVKQEENRT